MHQKGVYTYPLPLRIKANEGKQTQEARCIRICIEMLQPANERGACAGLSDSKVPKTLGSFLIGNVAFMTRAEQYTDHARQPSK